MHMLTKEDLKAIQKLIQQETRKIIREEVEAEVKNASNELGSDLRMARMEIQSDIRELSTRTKNVEIALNRVEKDTIQLKKGQRSIASKLNKFTKLLDRDIMYNRESLRRVEEKLNLDPIPFPKA